MNKKLIKTIASITCGLGIATTIPFIASSCGSNNEPAEQVQIEYNGSEDSKKLEEIAFNTEGYQTTTSSSGSFSIIPEKPSSFSWSFNVWCWNIDQHKYIEYQNWNKYLNIEINNNNKLQVTAIGDNPMPIKIDVFGKTKSGHKTNTITGFDLTIHC